MSQQEEKLRPPSRASEPIIQLAIINFHDKTIAVPDCLIPPNLDQSFGIVDIHIRDEIPIVNEIHISYMIDRSGSMSDVCADGRSKMTHIVHTLENMIRVFHKKTDAKISIRVQSFDHHIHNDVNTVDDLSLLTQEELEVIITQVHKISPNGSTNIEKALKASTSHLEKYIKNHPSAHVVNILLTDGEITDGSNNKTYLKTLVGTDYPNIFMGYGLHHDAALLTSLASTRLHNEYRFVNNLEKAGLVYGEVIHQLLYTALEDVSLKAEGCEIYDYLTNTWTTDLALGHLVSEQKKTYQVRSLTPLKAQIAIYGRTIHKTRMNEHISDEIIIQTHALPMFLELAKCDLTNYLFRQKTQEFLFATKELLERQAKMEEPPSYLQDVFARYSYVCRDEEEEKAEQLENQQKLVETIKGRVNEKEGLKRQLKDFFKIMLNYIASKELKEDIFFKTLCDDIYIAIKSFDTAHGMMYTAARKSSQGRQQTYTCKIVEEDEPEHKHKHKHKTKDDLEYELSQEDTSAYSGAGVLKMMRAVSGPPPVPPSLTIVLPKNLPLDLLEELDLI